MKTPTAHRPNVALLAMLLALPFLFPQNAQAAHYPDCTTSEVTPLAAGIDGKALVCNSRYGLYARMRASGFTHGDAYTVWWVYIDDPSVCNVPGECALEDFGGENPMPVFGRMDSAVAGKGRHLWFSDRLRGLTPSEGSQIWLLVFGHGPGDLYDNRHRARQLLTPEDPHAGAPHLGNFVDGPLGFPAAVAVFSY